MLRSNGSGMMAPAGLGKAKIREILNNISQLVLASSRTGYQYI
jgi:hypothetical protein